MAKNNSIRDDELLYRRIKDNDDKHPDRHISDKHGNLKKISQICFYDKKEQISVLRASLMNSNPRPCRHCVTEGVVGFTVGKICSTIEIEGYKIKVRAKPENTHDCKYNSDEYFRRIAHAIIFLKCIDSNPPYTEKRAFRTLMQGLAKTPTKWILAPHQP